MKSVLLWTKLMKAFSLDISVRMKLLFKLGGDNRCNFVAFPTLIGLHFEVVFNTYESYL